MAVRLLGAPVADALTLRFAERARRLAGRGVVPTLAIMRVGERDDDLIYERAVERRCSKAGVTVRRYVLDAECRQGELTSLITRINKDADVHGCLMFRPLPPSIDERAVCAALDPAKDVDGITPGSLYGIFAATQEGFPPCTSEAVIALLDYYGHDMAGANVTIIGRSLVVGRPLAMLLLARNATVRMCHTGTRNLAAACRDADVVVVAAGHAGVIGAHDVSAGQVVVDVGVNWDEAAGRLRGDVDYEAVESRVGAITPVPGGVGGVTSAVLVAHVIMAAERQSGLPGSMGEPS